MYVEAWLLLFGEVAGLWSVLRARILGYEVADDAAALARKSSIPAVLSIAGRAALIGWCV